MSRASQQLGCEVVRDDVAERGGELLASSHAWVAHSPATRRAIIQAALNTFAARGYHGSTLKDISHGTGMSTAALYVHFDSKEELLFEISLRGHEAALEVLEKAVEAARSPQDALDLVVYTFTRWHAEQRILAYVVQHEWSALNDDHVEAVQHVRAQIQAAVRGVLKKGAEVGDLDVPDLRSGSAAVLSLCIDVARWFEPDGPYTPDGLARSYVRLARKVFALP